MNSFIRFDTDILPKDIPKEVHKETKQQREEREDCQNKFPGYIDLPDLLDHPDEYRIKIGEAISALTTTRAELVDLLSDKYCQLICIDPYQICKFLSRELFNQIFLPIISAAEKTKNRLTQNENTLRGVNFFYNEAVKAINESNMDLIAKISYL